MPWTMTQTLFGGMLLLIALFFILRRCRVALYWAGVISALLVLLGYLLLSQQHWPGGDVLAIHLVVYLATAGVLVAFSQMQAKQNAIPQGNARQPSAMHWAPKLIIGFFVFLALLNALLLSLSMNGLPAGLSQLFLPNAAQKQVNTAFPGVMPHDKNKSYEPHLNQLAKQRALAWAVDTSGLQTLRPGQPSQIAIHIKDKQGQPLTDAQVRLDLWRIADSRDDLSLPLKPIAPGHYAAQWQPIAGRWMSLLSIQRGDDEYSVKASINISAEE